MIISYTENDTLIFEKEITLRSTIKMTGKITILTLIIISCNSITSFAAVPWYKEKLDQGGMYILLRLLETVYCDRVIEGIEQLEQLPKEVIDWIVEAGYTVEEFIRILVENRS